MILPYSENTISEITPKIDKNRIKKINNLTNLIEIQNDKIKNINTVTSQNITKELLEIYNSLKNVYFSLIS